VVLDRHDSDNLDGLIGPQVATDHQRQLVEGLVGGGPLAHQ
jgi:hypothetical protein